MDANDFCRKQRKATLETYLHEIDLIRRSYQTRARRAQANAFDTGSDSSYKTARKWERREEILKIAEGAIYAELEGFNDV